jgi:hypothetical protein
MFLEIGTKSVQESVFISQKEFLCMKQELYIWSGHFGEEKYLFLLLLTKPQFLYHPACGQFGILAPVAMV